MNLLPMSFGSLFGTAFAGPVSPFSWQLALAEKPLPEVLIAPTGSGKTAGVTLAWMYHRLRRPGSTPRRLVWCLPMRTLVDQTAAEVCKWVQRIDEAGIDPDGELPRPANVHVLMGGVDSTDWIKVPEHPSVLVGTQDMLLSRVLMRGYASSRAMWPMEFGLLHEDTQWVFDEVQLMGAGRATSAQLEGFRQREYTRAAGEHCSEGRPSRSLWISATLAPEWLHTVDHAAPTKVFRVNPEKEADDRLLKLAQASKHLRRADVEPASASDSHQKTYLAQLARSVVDSHRENCLTLVIVNQVKRAQGLHDQVQKLLKSKRKPAPELALIHSRFRPADREREMGKIVGPGAKQNVIAITTQAVEAGVDVSATVMFAELAPWTSMVQRFGRANRRAEVEDGAKVYWVDILGSVEKDDKKAIALAQPYEVQELLDARQTLSGLADAAPVHLPPPADLEPPLRVVRRKDLDDLFDTDADLTGFDVDISPYVRDADDTDLRVFWRELPAVGDAPPKPRGEELCAVLIGQAKDWIKKTQRKSADGLFFIRDPQWRRNGNGGAAPPGWKVLGREAPWPGLTVLADIRAGGYSDRVGFTGQDGDKPAPIEAMTGALGPTPSVAEHGLDEEGDGHDADPRSETGVPVRLTDHLHNVTREVLGLCTTLGLDNETRQLLTRAARWHDLGKAHGVFQDTMRRGLDGQSDIMPDVGGVLLAKTVRSNLRHGRAYFRHELASALAFLAHEQWSRDADLVAYLIAAHHGKVRMNLRALPRERAPSRPERAGVRFARGVWEGDELPSLHLGGDEYWPGGSLTLSIMEMGWDDATKESWTERTRELLTRLGPFRLAWLETLLRIADWRASGKEATGGYGDA